MTTTTGLTALALAAATLTTVSLVADTASARAPIPSASRINKVFPILPRALFIPRPSKPVVVPHSLGTNGSDNSTVKG
jgi:hypothetical protein